MKKTPAPQNTTAQRIEKTEFTPKARLTTESRFGNRIAYWEVGTPPGSLDLKMNFVCTRRDILPMTMSPEKTGWVRKLTFTEDK